MKQKIESFHISLIFLSFLIFIVNSDDDICGENNDERVRSMPGLQKKLKLIRLDCGQVCDTNVKPTKAGKYYDFIEKNVDCLALFESPVLEQTRMEEISKHYQPPYLCELPKQLRDLFSYNGRIKVLVYF